MFCDSFSLAVAVYALELPAYGRQHPNLARLVQRPAIKSTFIATIYCSHRFVYKIAEILERIIEKSGHKNEDAVYDFIRGQKSNYFMSRHRQVQHVFQGWLIPVFQIDPILYDTYAIFDIFSTFDIDIDITMVRSSPHFEKLKTRKVLGRHAKLDCKSAAHRETSQIWILCKTQSNACAREYSASAGETFPRTQRGICLVPRRWYSASK